MPTLNKSNIVDNQSHVIQGEMFDELEQEVRAIQNIEKSNPQKTAAYQMILKAVIDSNEPRGVFFIDALDGYGKTFLLETVLSSIHLFGEIALAVVSFSAITAELLQGGQTAHLHFKIPIPISDESMCLISLQSSHAKLMQQTALIYWR